MLVHRLIELGHQCAFDDTLAVMAQSNVDGARTCASITAGDYRIKPIKVVLSQTDREFASHTPIIPKYDHLRRTSTWTRRVVCQPELPRLMEYKPPRDVSNMCALALSATASAHRAGGSRTGISTTDSPKNVRRIRRIPSHVTDNPRSVRESRRPHRGVDGVRAGSHVRKSHADI